MGKNNEARFTVEEFVSAGVGGVGLFLVIIGLLLGGFGTISEGSGNLMVTIGLILLFFATLLWVVWTQPWKKFDDLQTAYYTGHDHAHDDHAHDDTHAEASAEVVESEGQILATAHEPIEVEMDSTGSSVLAEDAAEEIEEEKAESVAELATETPPSQPVAVDEEAVEAEPVQAEPEPAPEPKVEAKPKPAKKETKKAEPVVEESTEPQDLTVVEGIGPKTAQALEAEGITTYAQLAKLSADEIEEIVKVKHKVRIISGAAETWPKQAMYLAVGDEEGLASYQSTLKGGREVG